MNIFDVFKKSKKVRLSEAVLIETTSRVYLKELALNICINYIARTIANSDFRIMDDKQVQRDLTYYKLNVRPNTDQSASDFWQSVVYKLIYDNEVLVIQSDTEDLIIADSFQRNHRALYDDYFTDVIVGDYTYRRSFEMSDVFYLNYTNERLESYIHKMYEDYGKLFGQVMDNAMRHNQFRGVFKFKDGGNLSDEAFEMQQDIVERLRGIFENNTVALAPLTDGIELTDMSSRSGVKDESVNDLVKLKKDLIDDVAKCLSLPPNLVHGDVADLQNTMEAYVSFCINPLLKKISDELNAKFIGMDEFLEGKHIRIFGINRVDPLNNATAGDKLISSGAYSRNEVRELFGDERVDDPEMDRYIMTKNYTHVDDEEAEDETLHTRG